MQVQVLKVDQGKTVSVSSEGMTPDEIRALQKSLEDAGGRYVIFPTTDQMLIWQALVAGT